MTSNPTHPSCCVYWAETARGHHQSGKGLPGGSTLNRLQKPSCSQSGRHHIMQQGHCPSLGPPCILELPRGPQGQSIHGRTLQAAARATTRSLPHSPQDALVQKVLVVTAAWVLQTGALNSGRGTHITHFSAGGWAPRKTPNRLWLRAAAKELTQRFHGGEENGGPTQRRGLPLPTSSWQGGGLSRTQPRLPGLNPDQG